MNASEIKKLIQRIANVRITFNSNTRDYLFNGNVPRTIPSDFYPKLYMEYKTRLLAQFRENCSTQLIEKYIELIRGHIVKINEANDTHRVSYVFSRSKSELSEMAESTHDDIAAILSGQLELLEKMKEELQDIAENVKFAISGDFDDKPNHEQTIDSSVQTGEIKFSKAGKAVCVASKVDIMLFFYLLEKAGLISFEDTVHRSKFIEENFQYTVLRNTKNKNEKMDINGVNVDMAKFQDFTKKRKYTIAQTRLISKLYDKLRAVKFDS